jgi:hypothetical protein
MFRTFARKVQRAFRRLSDAFSQRRAKKLARIAEVEKRERKVIVSTLAKKLEAARAECEEQGRKYIELELSVKEIIFIEWNLSAWTRHFKESEIFEAPPRRQFTERPH